MSGQPNSLSIPLYNNSQLIKNSIGLDAISDLIQVINHNHKFIDWVLANTPSIMRTCLQTYHCDGKKYTLTDLFTFDINDINNLDKLPDLDPTLINQFMDNIPEIYKSTGVARDNLSDMVIKHSQAQTPGLAYGGSAGYLIEGISVIAVLGAILITKMYPSVNTSIVVLGDATDERRIVLGVIDISSDFRFCIKYTNHPQYIDDYKIEARIYKYFSDLLKASQSSEEIYYLNKIVKYYGSNKTISKDYHIGVSYYNPINRSRDNIKVNLNDYYKIKELSRSSHGFYMCTEWINNDTFIAYQEVKDHGAINKAFLTIINNLGYLNYNYGFYHGDLHTGNVFVTKHGDDCKFFDFDFSGIIGRINNNTLINMFNILDDKNSDPIVTNYRHSIINWKNYLYFFDVIRLYSAIVFYKFKSLDILSLPINQYTADNTSLRFPISCITYILLCINKINTSGDISGTRLMEQAALINNIKVKNLFNKYFCSLDLTYLIYKYITQHRINGTTEYLDYHLDIPSVDLPEMFNSCTPSIFQQNPKETTAKGKPRPKSRRLTRQAPIHDDDDEH